MVCPETLKTVVLEENASLLLIKHQVLPKHGGLKIQFNAFSNLEMNDDKWELCSGRLNINIVSYIRTIKSGE
jgi:hypothetical protein